MTTDLDLLTARAQVGLAFFYGAVFLLMFAAIVFFWDKLSKLDASVLSVFTTGAFSQAKDGAAFFFARHRPTSADSSSAPANPTQPAPPVIPSIGVTS